MARRTRILFAGDSVTAGYGLAGGPTFVQLTTERLAERGVVIEPIVDALDGADSRYLLRRFDRMITAHDPDWVVLAIGLNDARPPEGRTPCEPANFAGNLLELVDRILSLGARPLLVVQNPRWDRRPNAFAGSQFTGSHDLASEDLMQSYASVVRSIAEALGLPVVDLHHALLNEPDGAAMIPDGTHPNAEGHELMADLVTEELLTLLGTPKTHADGKAGLSKFDPFRLGDSNRN